MRERHPDATDPEDTIELKRSRTREGATAASTHLRRGDFSYEVGTEHVDVLVARNEVHTDFRVTNIYRREGGEWRMVHHHTDLNLRMLEILSKLETSQQNVSGV